MNKPYITAILAITSLSFSAGAIGAKHIEERIQGCRKNIEVEHEFAKANCASFADNSKELCVNKIIKYCGK